MAQEQEGQRLIDILAHPVRLRIVRTLAHGEVMTPQQLGEALPDVPQASLYRHLRKLVAGNVLIVARERQARGAVERAYTLRAGAGQVSPAGLQGVTREDLSHLMTAFVSGLLDDMSRYLSREDANPTSDGFTMRQIPLYLTDEERDALLARLRELFLEALKNGPSLERRQYLYTIVAHPLAEGLDGRGNGAADGGAVEVTNLAP